MSAGIYQLAVIGDTSRGDEWQNVFNYQVFGAAGGPSNLATAKSLVEQFIGTVTPTYLGCMSHNCFITFIGCRLQFPAGQPTYTVYTPTLIGTRIGDLSQLAAGPMVAWLSDDGGNRVGKTFLPGIAVDDTDIGHIGFSLGEAIAEWKAAMLLVLDLGSGETGNLCIYDRSTHTGYEVTYGTTRTKLGVQRRRLLGIH